MSGIPVHCIALSDIHPENAEPINCEQASLSLFSDQTCTANPHDSTDKLRLYNTVMSMTAAPKKERTKKKKASAKKARRKKNAEPQQQQQQQQQQAANDPMNQCVRLCQEQRWREALLLCRRVRSEADSTGKNDLYNSLSGAQNKIEYSLRRQMATALVEAAKDVLAKEYLLDVGELQANSGD